MANIINAKDLRPGHTFLYKNNIYLVIENSFNKTAMREGIVKCKVKNLRTGTITVEVLTKEKLEQANIQKQKCVFSYIDNENYIFIDLENFNQYPINSKKIDWEKNFITEGLNCSITIYENEILGIELPDQVTIKVDFSEEAVQGNSVTTALKKAILVTGYELDVPQFIKTGDEIIVDVKTGNYIGREN